MGFLSGAYGKLMAGKLVRDIQYRLTGVQSRLRRVSREIGQKQQMYQAQERNMRQLMQSQMQYMQWGGVQNVLNNGGIPGVQLSTEQLQQLQALAGVSLGAVSGGAAAAGSLQLGSFDTTVTTLFSQIQQKAQMQYANAQAVWQNISEMQREADVQALKDLEDELQVEKDNLESQLQIAKAEYDAKKEEEKDGAKNLKPDYTGQG